MTIQPYQIFGFMPQWASGIEMKYRFNTAIFTSEQYLEQRKPLKNIPALEQSFSLLLDYESANVLDFLRAGLNSIMYVPAWHEEMKVLSATELLPNQFVIDTPDTLNFFCWRNYCNRVIVIDRSDAFIPVIGDVQVKGDDTLTALLSDAWTFDGNTAVFPALEMLLDSFEKTGSTATLDEYRITFKKFITGDPLTLF